MGKKNKKKERLSRERRDKLKCDNCGVSNGYPRLKTQEWVCRSCGAVTSLKKKESKN